VLIHARQPTLFGGGCNCFYFFANRSALSDNRENDETVKKLGSMLTDHSLRFQRVRLVPATPVLGGSSANRTLLSSDLTPSTSLSSFLDGSRKTRFSANSSVLRFKLTHHPAFRCEGVSRQCRPHRSIQRRYHTTNVIDPIEIQVAVTATTFQTAGIRDNKGAGTNRSLDKSASARFGKEHT